MKPMNWCNLCALLILISNFATIQSQNHPAIVINTWGFTSATEAAWDTAVAGGSALDIVERGCEQCEIEQCDRTVGFGGSPDENGETRLDALIMDGNTMKSGSVASMKRIKQGISVARAVMEHTQHTLLIGDDATNFAIQMGFEETSLSTPETEQRWGNWKANNCQPNNWVNVFPDPSTSCGPYNRITDKGVPESVGYADAKHHDTISMVALDSNGQIAAGTSTNGATWKIPGRVGDGPITGSGSFADGDVGACGSTGDGDIMMRFVPCYQTVENMRLGMNPTDAAKDAMSRIVKRFPSFSGGIIALNIRGEYGAACRNVGNGFPFSVRTQNHGRVEVFTVPCI